MSNPSSYLNNWRVKHFESSSAPSPVPTPSSQHRHESSSMNYSTSKLALHHHSSKNSVVRGSTVSGTRGHHPEKDEFQRWCTLQGLRVRLIAWRAVSMGLSFLALILISSKLYSISKEVSFLHFIANDWLPKQNLTVSSKPTSQAFHIENLRQDVELLIIELWSSRTTLILGMVFVFAYILSWGWMSYVIQENRVSTKNVSLKSVLLLVVFAAVDIAASTGFVMVRLIMYALRDHNFPKDMRQLSAIAEHDQMAAFATLRLSALQSSSGTTDIFISGLVAFLTAIRVYIVACAVSFYNRLRKESFNFTLTSKYPRSSEDGELHSEKTSDDYLKPSHGNYMTWSKHMDNGHKDAIHDKVGNSTRKYSVTTTSVTGEDEVNADEFKIQAADMPIHMQRAAMHGAIQACRLYTTEKHIAESIKQDFDQMFSPTWHCIVGRNWGSCVTHSKQCYIRILYRDLTVLLYKST